MDLLEATKKVSIDDTRFPAVAVASIRSLMHFNILEYHFENFVLAVLFLAPYALVNGLGEERREIIYILLCCC